ncbi:uncharacterized protein RSE6_09297 [Rhynchosporium secalis]|uniref:Uncharacterized protein n=1 Tax=Rhynchosporium secalis TaxID=38038 RepID=A0A1E1MHK8_RHYSE|nr:uncharacterized protein RSE6_09297 [Rhynchosporium secalis]
MDASEALSEQGIGEIRRLRSQNTELQDRLDHSIAKIMILQGSIDEITAGEVKKRFQELYSAIQDWVADIELDLTRHSQDFQQAFGSILFQERQDNLLYHLGLRRDIHHGTGHSTWDSEFGKLRWLGKLDTCINVFLSRYIWCHLYQEILVTCYPLGIDDNAMSGLDYMMEAISGDSDGKANRDSILRANKWRAETMVTLTSTQKFNYDKESQMVDLERRLKRQLSQTPISLPAEILDKHFQDLEINVLRPAAALKQAIACSSVEYKYRDSEVLFSQSISEAGRVPGCVFKDIVKWRNIEPYEAFSGIFCCLFPGVYQAGLSRDDDLLLVESVILVVDEKTALQVQELGQMRDEKHSKSQRSPTRSEKTQPPSASPFYYRSSTTRSSESPQHVLGTGRREIIRSEPSTLGLIGKMFLGAIKSKTHDEEKLSPDARIPPSRRGSEDRREPKDKAKRSRRTETEPINPSSSQEVPSGPRAHTRRSRSNRDARSKSAINDEPTPINASVNLPGTVSQDSYHTRSNSQSEEESGDDSMRGESHAQVVGDDVMDIITVETERNSRQIHRIAMSPVGRTGGLDLDAQQKFLEWQNRS